MDVPKVSGEYLPAQKLKDRGVLEPEAAVQSPVDQVSLLGYGASLPSRNELGKIKSKWRNYKQFYNTDEPPGQIGVKSKKGRLHSTKQLVSKTSNSLGSLDKGFQLEGRFLTFSSWDHALNRVFSKLGLHSIANILDLETDEIDGGVDFEARILDGKGNVVAVRDGLADDEGCFALDVSLSADEKKKAGGEKELPFLIYFRGIRDEKDEYAHFNKVKSSDIPVGGGRIHLVSGEETITSSDIDKTIMDTSIGPSYFYQEPWSRKFLPGAAPFFGAIQETLHTISGSEQNVSTGIDASFELHEVRPAEADYKDWAQGKGHGSLGHKKLQLFEQVGYKVITEMETDKHLPDATKVNAHGDITEYDPLVYLLLHGILSGDLYAATLKDIFSRPDIWPELSKVSSQNRDKIISLTSSIGKKKGIDLICINMGSGKPAKPQLENLHGFTLDSFLSLADRLENIHPSKNLYRENIIFTDNYLQAALFYMQKGDSRVTEDTIVSVGKELIDAGFTPQMLAMSLKEVLLKGGSQTPREFLSREKLRPMLPKLKKAGILPRGFTV